MKALIADAGIGGLTTALFLHRAGIEVEIFERGDQVLRGTRAGREWLCEPGGICRGQDQGSVSGNRMTGQAGEYPLLPLGGGVLLAPPMARSFGLGRPESIATAGAASVGGQLVFASLRDPEGKMSGASSVFGVGATAVVIEAGTTQGVVRIFVEAVRRVHLRTFTLQPEGFYRVSVEHWDDPPRREAELRPLHDRALRRFEVLCRRAGLPAVTTELVRVGAPADRIAGIRSLPWLMLSYLGRDSPPHWIPVAQRQALLEAPSLSDRLRLLIELFDSAIPPVSLAADMTPFILRAADAAQLS